MKSSRFITTASLAIALGAAAGLANSAHAANLVTNGGFETGDFTGWTTTPAASGSYFGVSNLSHTGSHSAFFDGTTDGSYDSISQNIATTPGDTYQIDYWLRITGGGDNDFFMSWNGSQVAASNVLNSYGFDYTEFTFDEVATGSSTPLQFSAYSPFTPWGLDDISVTDLSPAVPEPASLSLIGLGAAALLARRRGKK